MKAKKKIFKKILLVLLVLIAVLWFLFVLFGDKAIKVAVQKAGHSALGVPVLVDDIDLKVIAGKLEIDDLSIGNPEGYKTEHLLSLGNAKVDVAMTSLMSDTITIDHISLNDIALVIEQKGLTNNLKEISEALPKPEEKPEGEAEEEKEDEKGKSLVINTLEIKNVSVKVKLLQLNNNSDTISIKLPTITLKDIGKKKKVDLPELFDIIFVKIVEAIGKAGTGILPEDMLGSVSDIMKEQGLVFKEHGGKLLEKGADAGKEIGEQAGELLEGIGGMFKKKED